MSQNKQHAARATALGAALLAASLCGLSLQAQAAATIVINNINVAGVGFNDTTPAAPVGGNTGTTLGEQRLIAFTYAANIWGATLTSSVPIIINASFEPLTCSATTAVLGSAGATTVAQNFVGAPKANTWYSAALANKLLGAETGTPGAAQIRARFNSNLGLNPDCLPGSPFYLGIDNNHGALVDFPTVLLHEMGHGVGFQTFTSNSTGVQFNNTPAIWDHFLMGTATGKLWKDMTDAERQASAISGDKLVWTGANVNAAAPNVLRRGLPELSISGSSAGATAGPHAAGEASFGPALSNPGVTAPVMPVVQANGTLDLACNPLTGANALAVKNNVALVSRGTCGFTVKVKNAQNAGAKAVLIADNAVAAISGLGGSDATITIPAVRITLADGQALLAQLGKRTRTSSGVTAFLGLNLSRVAGLDAQGRMMMYAPNPVVPGSSVSHFDVSAARNQLMEPSINGDLLHTLLVPADLTFKLLQDIGW